MKQFKSCSFDDSKMTSPIHYRKDNMMISIIEDDGKQILTLNDCGKTYTTEISKCTANEMAKYLADQSSPVIKFINRETHKILLVGNIDVVFKSGWDINGYKVITNVSDGNLIKLMASKSKRVLALMLTKKWLT